MQTLDLLNGGRVPWAKRGRSWLIFDVPVIAINALAGLQSIEFFGGSRARRSSCVAHADAWHAPP